MVPLEERPEVETEIYNIYADSKNVLKIAQINELEYNLDYVDYVEQNMHVVVPEYKHTFTKASNGEYYWVSTEMINKDKIEQIPHIN